MIFKMNWINKLNDKLNYNQEMLILSWIIFIIFGITSIILFSESYKPSLMFLILTTLFLGISISYYLYNRNDDPEYGYKVRNKIRSWFGK